MVSERLKNELAELHAKMLDIRDVDPSSPEHLKCMCESIKNLQAVMTEMVLQQADAHVAQAAPVPATRTDAAVAPNPAAA